MLSVKKPPLLLKKTDLLFIFLIITAALVGLIFSKGTPGSQAVVRIEGQTVQTLSLSKNGQYTFSHNGIHLTVAVQNRTVAVTDSSCPDGLCLKTGALTNVGQTAVCLPAAFSLTIEDAHSPIPDGITY